MKKSSKQKTYILAVGVILSLLVLVIGVLNQAGYVLSGPYIVKGAIITVTNALPGSTIFINNKEEGVITGSNGILEINGVTPGTHTIIVAEESSWPWIREFQAAIAEEKVLAPLQLPQNASGSALEEDSPFYAQATQLLSGYREPTQSQPLEWEGARLWVVGTTVQAQRADDRYDVLQSQYPIRSVAWYKDRNDVVLIAASNAIFAIDLEEQEPRNFQPIYRGVEPSFVVNPTNSNELYVSDGGHILAVQLNKRLSEAPEVQEIDVTI